MTADVDMHAAMLKLLERMEANKDPGSPESLRQIEIYAQMEALGDRARIPRVGTMGPPSIPRNKRR